MVFRSVLVNEQEALALEEPRRRAALQFTGATVTSNSVKLSFIRDHYLFGVIDKEVFPSVTGIEQTNNPIAIVSDLFLRKATKTLDAICVLCETDFAEDALVLGRTLFELVVYLKWIALPASIEQKRLRAETTSSFQAGSIMPIISALGSMLGSLMSGSPGSDCAGRTTGRIRFAEPRHRSSISRQVTCARCRYCSAIQRSKAPFGTSAST